MISNPIHYSHTQTYSNLGININEDKRKCVTTQWGNGFKGPKWESRPSILKKHSFPKEEVHQSSWVDAQ